MGFAISFQHPYVGPHNIEVRVQESLVAVGSPIRAIPKRAVASGDDEPQKVLADKLDAEFGKSWFHGWVIGQEGRAYGKNRPPFAAARLKTLKIIRRPKSGKCLRPRQARAAH